MNFTSLVSYSDILSFVANFFDKLHSAGGVRGTDKMDTNKENIHQLLVLSMMRILTSELLVL